MVHASVVNGPGGISQDLSRSSFSGLSLRSDPSLTNLQHQQGVAVLHALGEEKPVSTALRLSPSALLGAIWPWLFPFSSGQKT